MPLKTGITLHCSWCSDGFVGLLWKYVAENRANNYDIDKKIVNLGFDGVAYLSLSCHRSWPQSWLPSLRALGLLHLSEIVSASSTRFALNFQTARLWTA